MGEAKRKKQLAELRRKSPPGTVLPTTLYDLVKKNGWGGMLNYIALDLKRLRDNPQLKLQDILPPLGECNESAWIEAGVAGLSRNPSFARQWNSWTADARAAWLGAYVRIYRTVLAHEHGGRVTYFIHPDLSQALAYTQLNYACDQFNLPAEGCCIVFADDVARDALASFSNHDAQITGAVCAYLRTDELPEVGFRRLVMNIQNVRDDSGQADVGAVRHLALRPDWDLEQALRTDWEKIDPKLATPSVSMALDDSSERYAVSEGDMEAFFGEAERLFRMVINAVLYITSKSPLLEQRTDPTAEGDIRAFTAVGTTDAQADYTDVHRVAGERREDQRKTARRLTVRYLQPGFWRRPPNTIPTHPKTIWVSPHHRGPDAAELIERARVVS